MKLLKKNFSLASEKNKNKLKTEKLPVIGGCKTSFLDLKLYTSRKYAQGFMYYYR